MKIKNVCSSKDTVKGMNRQAAEGGRVIKTLMSHERLMSRMCELINQQ